MPVTFALKQDTVDGLQARVSELTDRIEAYRDQYDADSPAAVDVLEFDAEQVDDVYVDLGDWATAIEERRFHERARREVAGSTAPSHGRRWCQRMIRESVVETPLLDRSLVVGRL